MTSPPWECRAGCQRGRAVTLLAMLLASIATPPLAGGDWPQWRGPHQDGISEEKGWATSWPQEGPKRLWEASVGIGFSSVAVAQGTVFTLGNTNATDTVYAFDALTGAQRWQHAYACPLDAQYYEGGPGSTPTVEAGKVYTFSKRGHLFCFEATTGRVLWQRDLSEELGLKKPRWGFAGSPVVEGELLLLNAGSAGAAVFKQSGNPAWCSGTEPAGYATPRPFTFLGERVVAIFAAKALVAARVKDGRELWRQDWVTRWDINIVDPLLAGDRLFLSSFDRGCGLLQLGRPQPSLVWTNKELAIHFNSGVLLDGFVYGIHGNSDQPERDLRCLALATGQVQWRAPGFGLGSLIAADGKLIVLGEKGELAVAPASPTGFKPVASAQVLGGKCWTQPVLANGLLYCRNAQGTLICLDLRKP